MTELYGTTGASLYSARTPITITSSPNLESKGPLSSLGSQLSIQACAIQAMSHSHMGPKMVMSKVSFKTMRRSMGILFVFSLQQGTSGSPKCSLLLLLLLLFWQRGSK